MAIALTSILMFELGIGEAELVKAFMEKDFEDIKAELHSAVLN